MLRFSSVDDSQFGKLLVQFRSRMNAIKQKYADVRDSSLERKQADAQVVLLEGMLDTAQQHILPQFDNGNTNINYASLMYHAFFHRNDHLQFESAEFKILRRIQALVPAILKEAAAKSFTGSMTLYVSVYLKKYFFELKDEFHKEYVKTPGRNLQNFVEDLQYYITALGLYQNPDNLDKDNLTLKANLFRPNAYIPYTFDVGHLMMFEMLIETTKLANEISEDLHGLLSFLNPSMLALDFSSGFTGSLMSRFLNKVGKVEHVKDYQFNYIETNLADNRTTTYAFNAETVFGEFKEFAFSFLLSGIHIYISNVHDPAAKVIYDDFIRNMQQYFESNKETVRVKSLHARTAIIREFIEKEVASFSAEIKGISAKSRPDEYFTTLHGVELAAALQAEIINDNEKYARYKQLLTCMTHIRIKRLQDLLASQPSMRATIMKFQEQGCDMSFLRAPMPLHAFQMIDDQLTIVPLGVQLRGALLQLCDDLNFDPKRYKRLLAWKSNPTTIPKITKRGDLKMRLRTNNNAEAQVPSTIEALRADIEKLTERNNALLVKSVTEVNFARSQIKQTLAAMLRLTNSSIDVDARVAELVNNGEALNNWLVVAVDSFGTASEADHNKILLKDYLSRINNPVRRDAATFDEINRTNNIDKFLELVGASVDQISQWKSCKTNSEKKAAIAMLKPLIITKMAAIDNATLASQLSNNAYQQFYALKMQIVEDCKTIIDFDCKAQLEKNLRKARLVEQFRVRLAGYSEQLGMPSAFVEMDNFIQTGEIELLSAELFAARNNFMNDIQYRTLMNQTIIELHDLDREYQSIDYQALRINAEIKEKTPEAQALYNEINTLEQAAKSLVASHQDDGLVIQQLAKMLRRDADCYLAGHAGANFLEVFKARLHSQDVIMEKHKSILPVLANIALLVFSMLSAGLVAAVRVGYSKATTGKYTFFVNTDSALQLQAEAIVRSVPAA